MSRSAGRPDLPARYSRFIDELRSQRRYFFSADSRRFLARLGRLAAGRVHELARDASLYRARKNAMIRRGSDYLADMHPWSAAEMIPAPNMGTEDRANPYNIPMLYLATSPEIAIAEVRAGIDFPVTVATFRLRRSLRLIDLDAGDEGAQRRRPEARLWQRISVDFSRPLSAEERRLSCLHTQTIAELFRERGFDGLLYRSQFTAWRGGTAIASRSRRPRWPARGACRQRASGEGRATRPGAAGRHRAGWGALRRATPVSAAYQRSSSPPSKLTPSRLS